MDKLLLCVKSEFLLNFFCIVIISYFSITIIIAVTKSSIAKKYSTKAFFLLFLTKFLIPEPKAAQTDIERGQIINAVIEINEIEIISLSSLGRKPEATIVEIVHALGLTS